MFSLSNLEWAQLNQAIALSQVEAQRMDDGDAENSADIAVGISFSNSVKQLSKDLL